MLPVKQLQHMRPRTPTFARQRKSGGSIVASFASATLPPTCVLDFAYADHGRGELNLSPDDSMLERLYCFEDREDDMHLLLGGRRRRVILKVHTLRKWRERGDKLYERDSKVTQAAVKFMYAYWNADTKMFDMDRQSGLKLLPVSDQQQNEDCISSKEVEEQAPRQKEKEEEEGNQMGHALVLDKGANASRTSALVAASRATFF